MYIMTLLVIGVAITHILNIIECAKKIKNNNDKLISFASAILSIVVECLAYFYLVTVYSI
ncbi:hypothetical protein FDB30_04285 [Clostridium botulinum]|uniref:hypothetical protein n=2 Tax=Clostridium botulinum TaxID=1491 RepID=UPI0006A6E8DD|nr:hypothetical protein [Clostridium botulinum]KAI3346256.1 hypothetical protein CIT18_14540 [Clostridium botulinum]KOM88869.1 hypothetical protein ACP51_06495 [Clostridium botulinum]KOR57706.1 hypothetical protein ADT22_13185 [Clostridium botulinum]NFG39378.1 hypothetical protein [Clostridium botulinum]NFI95092.1 hypothetical protein [Clostridium botulinum]